MSEQTEADFATLRNAQGNPIQRLTDDERAAFLRLRRLGYASHYYDCDENGDFGPELVRLYPGQAPINPRT